MTRTVIQPGSSRPDFETMFHREMLGHWLELYDKDTLPLSSSFRPQRFGAALSSLLMLHVDREQGICDGRIIGETVDLILSLKNTRNNLFHHPLQRTRELLEELLGWPEAQDVPIFSEGAAPRDQLSDVDYSALVLPFRKSADSECGDIYLVGFQFQESVLRPNSRRPHFGLPGREASVSTALELRPNPGGYYI